MEVLLLALKRISCKQAIAMTEIHILPFWLLSSATALFQVLSVHFPTAEGAVGAAIVMVVVVAVLAAWKSYR